MRTIKVKSKNHPNLDYVIINELDFDVSVHSMYEDTPVPIVEKQKEVEPETVDKDEKQASQKRRKVEAQD